MLNIGETTSSQDIINQNEKNDINIVQNLLCENVSASLQRSVSLNMKEAKEVSIKIQIVYKIHSAHYFILKYLNTITKTT